MRRLASAILIVGMLLVFSPASADAPDFAISNPTGHWYTQTNNVPGASLAGYPVVDSGGIAFWSEFQRLGGIAVLGYPVSTPFLLGGFVDQAFQKAILQWRPEVGHAAFLNVFDLLHNAGDDPSLLASHQIPPPLATSGDAGKSWPTVVSVHQALLDGNAAIKAAYFTDPDPIDHYGLPMTGPVDEGDVIVVRTQRAAFQQWKQATPWAAAGQVTVANGGDLAKESGLIPLDAVRSVLPSIAFVGGGPYRHDSGDIAVHLQDLPAGFVIAGQQPVAPATTNGCACAASPTAAAAPTPTLQDALKPPDAIETSMENHGLANRVVVAYTPVGGADHATGVIYIQSETDVFQSSADADWDYHQLLDRFTGQNNRVANAAPVGDASTGLVGQDVRNSDSAPATIYTVLFREGNVTEGVTVDYVGAPGSFDLATQLARASLGRITTS